MRIETKLYIRERIRSIFLPLLYLSIASAALTFIFAYSEQNAYEDYYQSFIGMPTAIIVIHAMLAPVLSFQSFKKRRNLDFFWAMPISRRTLFFVHYILGLVFVLIPYTASYLVNFLLSLRYVKHLSPLPYLPYFFIALFLGILIYTVFTFSFNEANSVGDGIMFMHLHSLAPFMLLGAIMTVFDIKIEYVLGGIIYNPIAEIATVFSCMIEGKESYYSDYNFISFAVALIFWASVGALALIYMLKRFGTRRTERAEEISDSFFGYRVMIPLYAMAGMIIFGDFWFDVIIAVIAFVGYTVYRRGIKYTRSDLICLGVILLAMLL